jgi:putative ABC transport system ATP-binding protein
MPTDPTAAVAVRDLRFRYPHSKADAIALPRFDVGAGEQVFVRGPSGCGKTTLLSLLAGVLLPSSGTVIVAGQAWSALSAARRDRLRADRVGYIFQQFNLLPYLSVLDNVLLPCSFSSLRRQGAGGTRSEIRSSALRLLDQMGLDASFADREAAGLSVGQQQRVGAARALIGKPGLVIADEPTSALDEDRRESFMRVLLEACSEAGSALVFVSHDARLANRFTRQVDLARVNQAAAPAPELVQA